jgi:hypothetical protein
MMRRVRIGLLGPTAALVEAADWVAAVNVVDSCSITASTSAGGRARYKTTRRAPLGPRCSCGSAKAIRPESCPSRKHSIGDARPDAAQAGSSGVGFQCERHWEDAAMTRAQRIILVAVVLLILAGTHGALATISPSGIDARLRLDWEVSQTRGGRPEIQGYVINDYMRPAINVRLLVETLDGNGQATDRAYGFVVGGVPALNRGPFVVPLKTAGASYRISVTDFTWKDGGSAG